MGFGRRAAWPSDPLFATVIRSLLLKNAVTGQVGEVALSSILRRNCHLFALVRHSFSASVILFTKQWRDCISISGLAGLRTPVL